MNTNNPKIVILVIGGYSLPEFSININYIVLMKENGFFQLNFS